MIRKLISLIMILIINACNFQHNPDVSIFDYQIKTLFHDNLSDIDVRFVNDPNLKIKFIISINTTILNIKICQMHNPVSSCNNTDHHIKFLRVSLVQRNNNYKNIFETQDIIDTDTNGQYFLVMSDNTILTSFKLVVTIIKNNKNNYNNNNNHNNINTPSNSNNNYYGLNSEEYKCVQLINQYRKSRGLNELIIDPKINNAAKKNSLLQEKAKYSGHFTPGDYAEIAFYGPTTAERAVRGWKASPGHNALMLGSRFKKMGISAGSYGNSWTVNFK